MENQGRRRLIKKGLAVGGLLAGSGTFGLLQACASIDRLILSGKARDPNEVVIIGGGLAGLSAAYYCKKNGIPYLLFEASSRIGGRVLGIGEFNLAGQTADLGGEWILPNHEALHSLAKDLYLELNEVDATPQDFEYFELGKRSLNPQLINELQQFQMRSLKLFSDLVPRGSNQLARFNRDELPRAVYQDNISAEEYLSGQSAFLSPLAKQLLKRNLLLLFGAEPAEISSLAWLMKMAKGHDLLGVNSSRRFKLSGGSSVLTQALYDRVAGVIPDQFVRRSHVLKNVDYVEGQFELQFQTPTGPKTYSTKKIICTLPLAILKEISGIEKLPFPDLIHEYLLNAKTSSVSKGAIGFSERPWRKLGLSRFSGSFESQNFWESEPTISRRFQKIVANNQAILSFQLGGATALSAGLHSLQTAERDLQALKLAAGLDSGGQIHNWSLSPFAKGGWSYFGPGQTAKYGGLLSDSQIEGSWLFAGEGISVAWPGTMNGAIESARFSVNQLMQQRAKL